MDSFIYHSSDELYQLDLADLEALWELVPTARQKHYQDRLSREVHRQGAHSTDDAEVGIVKGLLERYQQDTLVPIGERWVKAPPRILEAARQGVPFTGPEQRAPAEARPLLPLLLLALGGLLFGGLLLMMLSGGSSAAATNQMSDSGSPTPRYTQTPTPLALVHADAVIREGDRDRSLSFPVGLQILTDPASQPRVLIVQRRRVELAEWHYDDNPDTASFLSDLPVRKIIGIPYTAQNAALFDELGPGAEFMLRLNTGGQLRFAFDQQLEVRRSDTQFLQQHGPGLVLVLIGETGPDGLPTGTRRLILARYVAEQEVSGDQTALSAGLWPTAIPSLTPPPSSTPPPPGTQIKQPVSLRHAGITTTTGQLTIALRIYNHQDQAVTLEARDIQLALGYAPQPPGPWTTRDFSPITLLPGQALNLTLEWPWQDEPFGTLRVLSFEFGITF